VKANKKLKIILIIAIELLIIIGVRYAIYRHDLNEQLQYEAEQSERRQFKIEESIRLKDETDKNTKIEYELMLQTIEENSEYYISFSKKFLSEFEKSGYEQNYPNFHSFGLDKVLDSLENEINRKLVGKDSEVRNEIGIIYVQLYYPFVIRVFDYIDDDFFTHYYYREYAVVYIPDEYMDDDLIAALIDEINISLRHVKDNLFLFQYPVPHGYE
jgi:hypothetical protein